MTAALTSGAVRTERLDPTALAQRGQADFRPWTSIDLARLLGINALALLIVAVGWWECSGETTVRGELAWFNVGIVGLGASGVANGTWLMRGRRSVGLARAFVLPEARTPSPTVPAGAPEEAVVSAANMSRYHRVGCPLAAGKRTTASDRHTFEKRGLAPCETCRP
jgi:hypothetical protein